MAETVNLKRIFDQKERDVSVPVAIDGSGGGSGPQTLVFDLRDYGAHFSPGFDDSSSLAAAVTAAKGAGGGTLWIPFPMSGRIVLPSHVNIAMDGGAYLRLPNSSTLPVVDTEDWSSWSATGTGVGAYGGLIDNIISGRFDGNRSLAPSGGPCLRLYGAGFTLQNVNAYHSATDCLVTEGPDVSGSDSGDLTGLTKIEPTYLSSWFHDSAGHGHRDNGPHDALKIKCVSYRNSLNGFYHPSTISGHGWSSGVQMIGCHAWGNGNWGIFSTGDAKNNGGRVTNCQIEGSGAGNDAHGQVFLNSANWVFDSTTRIFTQPANDEIGVVLAGAGGYTVDCAIYNCLTCALDISGVTGTTTGGTSIYRPRINQASGTDIIGTPHAGDLFMPNVSGGVTRTWPQQWQDSGAPGTGTWIRGDRVYFTLPSSGGSIGAVCTTGGTPGTWKNFGAIS